MEQAPELTGIDGWINSEPLTLSDLEGNPVLLDFWTYSRLECLQGLEEVRRLWEAYRDAGLSVIGVHTPEFSFEQARENVERAVEMYEVDYPVALDARNASWEAYGNMHRPRRVLIGTDGGIEYDSSGRGNAQVIEEKVRKIVRRAGGDVGEKVFADEDREDAPVTASPAVYAGEEKGGELGNSQPSAPHTTVEFSDGEDHIMNRIYLQGLWRREDEYLESEGDGYVQVRFTGSGCGAVLGPEGARFRVELDGEPVPVDVRGEDIGGAGEEAVVEVDFPRCHRLVELDEPSVTELKIEPETEGGRIYSFGFG